MILVPDSSCSFFMLHHLGEFECPHQYDFKARVRFANRAQQQLFCKLNSVNNSAMFTAQPEFILPEFVQNPVPFTTDITAGFFGDVVIRDVQFIPISVPFFAEYGVLTNTNMKYYLLPASNGTGKEKEFILWHVVTVPPSFDQVLLVSIPDFVWPADRDWPLLVNAGVDDLYRFRLSAPSHVQLVIEGVSQNSGFFNVNVLDNIYPSIAQYNGDGRTDFETYCVNKTRPTWKLCL